jgi:hypothetical protein
MTTKEDIQGREYDWLAVDSDGLVGLFSTAGGGYAPEEFLKDIDAFDSAIASILSLAVSSPVNCSRDVPVGLCNTWKMVAERGLFAFDSDPLGGPYRLIATPHRPVILENLPTIVKGVVSRVVLSQVTFRIAQEITEDQLRY